MRADADVHNDSKQLVELVWVIGIIRCVEQAKFEWEGDSICQFDVLQEEMSTRCFALRHARDSLSGWTLHI